jgi:hypothetical protein
VYPKDSNDDSAITVIVDYITHPTKLTSISDTLQLDSRFFGPIVAYVASRAFNVLGRQDQAEVWAQIYQRRVFPYLRSTWIGKPGKFAGPLLSENETEIE